MKYTCTWVEKGQKRRIIGTRNTQTGNFILFYIFSCGIMQLNYVQFLSAWQNCPASEG